MQKHTLYYTNHLFLSYVRIILFLHFRMKGYRHNSIFRSAMATLCIAIFLFSYANATMFWHGHMVTKYYWIYHSHIAGKAHRSAPIDKAHTSAELQLIQTVDQISISDDVISDCEVVPYRNVVEAVISIPEYTCDTHIYEHIVLRGPPSLV